VAVITISKEFGSGGNEIAYRGSEALGYRFFDKRMIIEAAKGANLRERDLVDLSEDNYRIRSFLGRLLSGTVFETSGEDLEEGEPVNHQQQMARSRCEEKALGLVQRAIKRAYEIGDTVIVGRGGQVVLRGKPNALHVRIAAPLEPRVQRVMNQLRALSHSMEPDAEFRQRAQAYELIQERDSASAAYLSCYYNCDWSDPGLYHMIINTAEVSILQAVEMIAGVARRSREFTNLNAAGEYSAG